MSSNHGANGANGASGATLNGASATLSPTPNTQRPTPNTSPRGPVMLAARNLGKRYDIARASASGPRPTTMGEALLSGLRQPLRALKSPPIESFWAVRNVNFDICEGDVVGVVGRNGAGKSTLLKLLSRITEPTEGEIDLYGRVGSLLEVGTGFHPELTGRENVYLNGSILGMTRREIEKQFDAIVTFAEVEKFLETPVKRYSSGMYVRLAFAVAAHLNPEILIVDEVLAVGDAAFQKKCLGKMQDVARGGRTVLFVSHNMAAVRALCNRALFLKNGNLILDDTTSAAVALYAAQGGTGGGRVTWEKEQSYAPDFYLVSARARNEGAGGDEDDLTDAAYVDCSRPFCLEVEYEIADGAAPITNLMVGFSIQTTDGTLVCNSHDAAWAYGTPQTPGRYVLRCGFPAWCLNEGEFEARFRADVPHERCLQITDFDLKIEVRDFEGYGVNAEKLPGIIRPVLRWDAPQPVSPIAGANRRGAEIAERAGV